MKGYSGNKVLLPLLPGSARFKGTYPLISEILKNLPQGPKALVLYHRKNEVITATRNHGFFYYEQSAPNGTGGALIAAQDFLRQTDQECFIITMGDIPFVKEATYNNLIAHLGYQDFVVLGFRPTDKSQYGMLEVEDGALKRIIEWRYWRDYPSEIQSRFEVCNSGIYAARRSVLLNYVEKLKQRPHRVEKERDGRMTVVEEYFITDLVEMMSNDGLRTGVSLVDEETEAMGVDTVEDLISAQRIFAGRIR